MDLSNERRWIPLERFLKIDSFCFLLPHTLLWWWLMCVLRETELVPHKWSPSSTRNDGETESSPCTSLIDDHRYLDHRDDSCREKVMKWQSRRNIRAMCWGYEWMGIHTIIIFSRSHDASCLSPVWLLSLLSLAVEVKMRMKDHVHPL